MAISSVPIFRALGIARHIAAGNVRRRNFVRKVADAVYPLSLGGLCLCTHSSVGHSLGRVGRRIIVIQRRTVGVMAKTKHKHQQSH